MDRFPKNISFSRSIECHNNNHSYDDAGDGGEEIFCFLTLFLLSFSRVWSLCHSSNISLWEIHLWAVFEEHNNGFATLQSNFGTSRIGYLAEID